MTFHERKLVAIVGLAQVGAIFASILACTLAVKMTENVGGHTLRGAEGVARWGWCFLLVPVIWAVAVLAVSGGESHGDLRARILMGLGVAVAGFFTIYAAAAILSPLDVVM